MISITAYLKDDRKLSTGEVIDKWLQEVAAYPDCTVSMEQGSSTGSTMYATRQIEVDLQGTDYDAVQSETNRLVEALRDREDVTQVHSSIENAAPAWTLRSRQIRIYRGKLDTWLSDSKLRSFAIK